MVANRIREWRQRRSLSQVRLGSMIGISSCTISDFELGKRLPWPKARRDLAEALEASEAELFPDGGGIGISQ